MNTKKTSLKVLSVILSALMVMSCMVTGLSAIAEDIGASAPVNNLQKAIEAWLEAGGDALDYSVYGVNADKDGQFAYIKDNTTEGYIYDIAAALVPAVNTFISTDAEEGVNSELRLRKALCEATGYTEGAGAAVIAALIPDVQTYDADFKDTLIFSQGDKLPALGYTYVAVEMTNEAALRRGGDLETGMVYYYDTAENIGDASLLTSFAWYSFGSNFESYTEYELTEKAAALKSVKTYFKANAKSFDALVAGGTAANLAALVESNNAKIDIINGTELSLEALNIVFDDITLADITAFCDDAAAAAEVLEKKDAVDAYKALAAEAADNTDAAASKAHLDALDEALAGFGFNSLIAEKYCKENLGFDLDALKALKKPAEDAYLQAVALGYKQAYDDFAAGLDAYYSTEEELLAGADLFKADLSDEALLAAFAEADGIYKALKNVGDTNASLVIGDSYTAVQSFCYIAKAELKARGIDFTEADAPEYLGMTAAQCGFTSFTQRHLHNGAGEFVTRKAQGSHQKLYVLANGTKQWKTENYNDVARHSGETDGVNDYKDNYVVTESRINSTIERLDKFLVSDEFTQLLGSEDAVNLSTFVRNLIEESLFTEQTVNDLMTSLYGDLIAGLPATIFDALCGIDGAENRESSTGAMDHIYLKLKFDVDVIGNIDVKLNIYVNGAKGTQSYPTLFHNLGLDIYPGYMANNFGSFPSIKSALSSAGTGINAWASSYIPRDADGNIAFNWGSSTTDTNEILGYAKFKTALTAMFGGIAPLLRTALCGATFNKKVTGTPAFVDAVASKSFIDIDEAATANVEVTIGGLSGFADIIAPLYEALGVGDALVIPTSDASVAQIVDSLLNPLMVLIDRVAQKPLEEVINLLPTLAYAVSHGLIEPLLDVLKLNINFKITDVDFDGGNKFEDWLIGMIVGWFEDKLDFDLDPMYIFKTASHSDGFVDLCEILKLTNRSDLTNLNKILDAVFNLIDKPELVGKIPTIDAAKLGTLATLSTDSSQRTANCGVTPYGAGQRAVLTADSADVFYDLFTFVFTKFGSAQTIIDLVRAFTGETEEAATPEEEEEKFHLNEVFTNLIDGIGKNSGDAFAALIELFNSQKYGYQHTTFAQSVPANTTTASLCYLKYGNRWTEESAKLFYDDSTEYVNTLLGLLAEEGEEAATLQDIVDGALGGLFNMKTLNDITDIFASLGALDIKENINQLIVKELGVNLATAYGKYAAPEDAAEDWTYWTAIKATANYDVENGGNKNGAITPEQFFDVLATLIAPVGEVLAMLLGGKDWKLFTGDVLVFQGYEGYRYGLIPIFEMLGMKSGDFVSYSAFESACATAISTKNYSTIIGYVLNPILNRIDEICANPLQELCKMLPNLLYALQTGYLTDSILNLLQGLLVIVDTARPIYDLDLPLIIDLIEQNEDEEDAEEPTPIMAALKTYLSSNTLKSALQYNNILKFVEDAFEIKFTALLTEAINGSIMFAGGVENFTSAANFSMDPYRPILDTTDTNVNPDAYQPWDVFTILISVAIELVEYKDNAAAIEKLINGDDTAEDYEEKIKPGTIKQICNLLNSQMDASYQQPVDYFSIFGKTAGDFLAGTSVHVNDLAKGQSIVYLKYNNNWNEETADYLDQNLENIVNSILALLIKPEEAEEGEGTETAAEVTLSSVIEDLLAGILTTDVLNGIVSTIIELLAQYEDLLSLAKVFLDVDLTAYLEKNDDGTYKYLLPEGQPLTLNEFIDQLETLLTPVEGLLSWLLLGEDIAFFNGSDYIARYDETTHTLVNKDGMDIISVKGSEGYANGIIPLLDAIGCTDLQTPADVKLAMESEDGALIRAIIDPLAAYADELLANPIDVLLDTLNNLIYFINIGGLSRCVNNILAGALNVVDQLDETGLIALSKTETDPETGAEEEIEQTIMEFLTDTIGIDITDITLDSVAELLIKAIPGLDISNIINFLKNDYFLGFMDAHVMANSQLALSMKFAEYYDEDENEVFVPGTENYYMGTRSDFITILVSLVLDCFEKDTNKDALIELFAGIEEDDDPDTIAEKTEKAEGIYDLIMSFLTGTDYESAEIDWDTFITDVTQDDTVTPANLTYLKYSTLWTREKAEYLYNNAEDIIEEVLNMNLEEGEEAKTLEGILKGLIDNNIYSADLVNKILETVQPLLATISEIDTEGYLSTLIKGLLDVDLAAVAALEPYDFETGDADAFVAAMTEVLTNLGGLLDWLFAGKDIAFFYDYDDGKDQIKLAGINGYADALIPIFEALGCTGLMTTAEFAAADRDTRISAVLSALTGRIAEIEAAPIEEISELLPNLIFFLQTGGLQTSLENLLGSVTTLLDKLNPVLGDNAIDLNELLLGLLKTEDEEGISLIPEDGDIFDLVDLENILTIVETATGLTCKDLLLEAVNGTYMLNNKNILESYNSANGSVAKRVKFVDDVFEPYDGLTILISALLETIMIDGNAEALEALINGDTTAEDYEEKIKPGTIAAILDLLGDRDFEFKTIDWTYFDEDFVIDDNRVGQTVTLPEQSIVYLTYPNNWNKDTADYLDKNLPAIVDAVISMATNGEKANLTAVLSDAVGSLLSNDTVNKIAGFITPILADISDTLLDLADLVLDVDLAYYKNLEADKDWGVTDGDFNSFADALKELLKPIAPVLNWLLLGSDLELFNGADYVDGKVDGDPIITVEGTNAYAYGIAPVLEAICGKGFTSALNIEAAYAEDVKTSALIDAIIDPLKTFYATLMGNPIDTAFDLINNLIYFINANGIGVSVYNILEPLCALTSAIEGTGLVAEGTLDLKKIITDKLPEGLDIENLGIKDICDIVKSSTADDENGVPGLDIYTVCGEFLENYYLGHLNMFTSANGQAAFTMQFNDDITEGSRGDFITILVSLILQVAENPANKEFFVNVLDKANIKIGDEPADSEKLYDAVITLLSGDSVYSDPAEFDWDTYVFGGDRDEIHIDGVTESDEITPSSLCYLKYGNFWTREKAEALYTDGVSLVDKVLAMTAGEGEDAKTVAGILADLISDNLYKTSYLDSLVGIIANLTEKLDTLGATGVYVENILKKSLRVDISAYDEYLAEGFTWSFADGDKDGFISALSALLAPLGTVLDLIFAGEDIKFFIDKDGKDQIVIKGTDGYANGLIPLLEALGCDASDILTTAEFKALDTEGRVKAVLTAVANRLDTLAQNPLQEAAKLLPELLYFVQTGALATVLQNITLTVFDLLEVIKPIYDVDLNGIINDALSESVLGGEKLISDDEDIFDVLTVEKILDIAEGATGLTCKDLLLEAVNGTYFLNDGNILEEYTSANGKTAKRIAFKDEFQPWDALTILVSAVVELVMVEGNAEAIEALVNGGVPGDEGYKETLKPGTIQAILDLLGDRADEFKTINWTYFDEDFDLSPYTYGQEITLPEQSIVYLDYPNNWTEETADYIDQNLEGIIDAVISLVSSGEQDTLAEFLDATLADLFSDDMINGIVAKLADAISSVDAELLETAGLFLDCDLSYYTALTGEETWGVTDLESFLGVFKTLLEPVAPVLNWLLLDKDLAVFHSSDHVKDLSDGDDLIVIEGTEGYAKAIVPLLEALGCEPAPVADTDNVADAIIDAVTGLYNKVMADPLNEAFNLINNLLYFINAGGASAAVYNLLSPVYGICDKLDGVIVEEGKLDLKAIIEDKLGFSLDNIDIKFICDLVKDSTGIDVYTICGQFLENYYLGHLEMFESANGEAAFRMVFNDDYSAQGTRSDFITIIFSLLLQVIENPTNKDAFIALLDDMDIVISGVEVSGTAAYTAITKLLFNLNEYDVPYEDVQWLFPEDADKDITHSALETSGMFTASYGKYWTREKAEYVDSHLEGCINAFVHLLGIELSTDLGEIIRIDDLEQLLDGLLNEYVFTGDIINKIVDKLVELLEKLYEVNGYEYIVNVVKTSIGIDLAAYDKYVEGYRYSFANGDRDAFKAAIVELIVPVAPALEWLLCDKDLAFFVDESFNDKYADPEVNLYPYGDQFVLPGSEGYAYGIIPLLEALDCDGILAPADYIAAGEADPDTLISNIIDPIFNKLDEIMADPANKLLEMLPEIAYFLNSMGLDACFKNILHSVYVILKAIEPIVNVDLYSLLGINLCDYDVNYLLNLLGDKLSESTGFKVTALLTDPVAELTMGQVVGFTSLNGEQAYRMVGKGTIDRADIITVVGRLVMEFIAVGDNAEALKKLARDNLSAETAPYVVSLIDTLHQAVIDDPVNHIDIMLGTFYYVFYGIDIGAREADEWLTDYNTDWQFIIDAMGNAESSTISKLGKAFAKLLDSTLDDVFDSDGLASSGLIAFFQKIINWFKKIIEAIKNIF